MRDAYWCCSHTDYPEAINDFLTTLIAGGMLEGAALGMAQLVIDEGTDSLTAQQQAVVARYVIRELAKPSCPRCGCDIRWSAMLHNDGWCAYCNHLLHKNAYPDRPMISS